MKTWFYLALGLFCLCLLIWFFQPKQLEAQTTAPVLTASEIQLKDSQGRLMLWCHVVKLTDSKGMLHERPLMELKTEDGQTKSKVGLDGDGKGYLFLATPGTPMTMLERLPAVGTP